MRGPRLVRVACWFVLALALPLVACDRNVGELHINILTTDDVLNDPFTYAKNVQVRIEGADMGVILQTFEYTPGGAATLPEIPIGNGRTVTIEVLNDSGVVDGFGQSLPINVVEGRNELDLFVGKTGSITTLIVDGRRPLARRKHVAVVRSDGRVALVGGERPTLAEEPEVDELTIREVDIFDPTAGQFTEYGVCTEPSKTDEFPAVEPLCLRYPRIRAAYGQSIAGDILAIGGIDSEGPVASVERLPASGRAFEVVGAPLSERLDATFILHPLVGPVFLGGVDRDDAQVSSVLLFNEDASDFVELRYGTGCDRNYGTPAIVRDQFLHVGGVTTVGVIQNQHSTMSVLRDVLEEGWTEDCYDEEDEEIQRPNVNYAEILGAQVAELDERFAVFVGGIADVDLYDPPVIEGTISNDVFLYDVQTGFFCNVGEIDPAQPGRYRHTVAPLPQNRVLVAGGVREDGGVLVAARPLILDFTLVQAALDVNPYISCDRFNRTLVEYERYFDQSRTLRLDPTATVLSSGMVLIAGGTEPPEEGPHNLSYDIYVPER